MDYKPSPHAFDQVGPVRASLVLFKDSRSTKNITPFNVQHVHHVAIEGLSPETKIQQQLGAE